MKPIITPASTGMGAIGVMLSTVLVWACKQFAGIDMPAEVGASIGGIVSMVLMHFTKDGPSLDAAREAADDAVARAKK